MNKVLLCILDGVGIRKESHGNALIKAKTQNLDILIVPSWDYPGVAEFQSKEARYKGIEGGFNLIKNTANGVVIASDYKGRILTYFSGKDCQDYFIVSELYKHGIKTLYSYIGQWFNFIYLISLLAVIYHLPNKEDIEIEKIKED